MLNMTETKYNHVGEFDIYNEYGHPLNVCLIFISNYFH